MSRAQTEIPMLNTLEDAQQHPLWARQEALETEMRSIGEHTFKVNAEKAREKGQETRVAPVRRLMGDAHDKMVAALTGFYAEVESKKAGRKHSAYAYLKPISIDVVAHLTCRITLDMSATRPSLTHLSVAIAEALEDEVNYRHFREQHEAGYLKTAYRAKNKGHAGYARRHVLESATKLGVELIEWPKRDLIVVGSKLVELFLDATNMIELNKTPSRIVVETNPHFREWIEKESETCALMSPTYLPTLIQPRPWTTPFEGGYWTGRARRLTLVKSPNRAYLAELAEQEMPWVYEAVNALQDTPWAINERVLAVMEVFKETGAAPDLIPCDEPLPLPDKPAWLVDGLKEKDMTEEQKELFTAWKGTRAEVYEKNGELIGRRKAFASMLWVAKKFREEEEFFYPYALDWRGRAYPVGHYLHPQGNDPQRGLLHFAELCPVNTQEQADWLAIHGAGLWGVDKVSFEERCAWVDRNEADILAAAENPYENRFWMTAENGKKAWQALAFCFEWAGFKKEGFGYLSSISPQMDGTCNGLQNFSAMLLDARGGAAVNLIPADKPQDIYSEVMELVKKAVERDLFSTEIITRKGKPDLEVKTLALMWHGNIERKTVKRPVMTLAYGATRFGFTDQINKDTVRKWKKEKPTTYPFGHNGFEAAQYLAGLTWAAVEEVVTAAAVAMEWLQQVATIVSKEELPIYWRTPIGLLVCQNYKVRNMKNVDLMFQKIKVQVKIDKGSEKLDQRKQSSGISPNWVHSLDASHMMKTICVAKRAGVRSFSFIHDSYGTHAGNTPFLAATLREQFVEMYQGECVLERFRSDLQAMLPEGVTLPAVPQKGALDLSKVLESPFFFA